MCRPRAFASLHEMGDCGAISWGVGTVFAYSRWDSLKYGIIGDSKKHPVGFEALGALACMFMRLSFLWYTRPRALSSRMAHHTLHLERPSADHWQRGRFTLVIKKQEHLLWTHLCGNTLFTYLHHHANFTCG
jgi:hypothetical protein